ncbi:hypothetical protein PQH03_06800 [Ralstonia insidiosa]|uniref:hypothetical protein n=1 Tax=Ralstonia insidiosa TaxID=190721 RepID=UPI002381C884|nr:hypothetical protein [Ralstonia insidiosa]MDE4924333.1 hypothetical protein [Ralstonia insidiosa]
MTDQDARRQTLRSNLLTHQRNQTAMQLSARIELDPLDVAAAIRDFIFKTTGRDIIGEVEVKRERGEERFSIPTAFDVGPEAKDETLAIAGA